MVYLVFARTFGMFAFIPFGLEVSMVPRLLLAAVLALCLSSNVPVENDSIWNLSFEFFLGATLGLSVVLLLEAAAFAGGLVDTLRGQTIGSLYDPNFQAETSFSGTLVKWVVLAVMCVAGVLTQMLELLVSSFELIPVGALSGCTGQLGSGMVLVTVRLLTDAALLVLIYGFAFLLVELVMGFASLGLPGVLGAQGAFAIKLALATWITLELLAFFAFSDWIYTIQNKLQTFWGVMELCRVRR